MEYICALRSVEVCNSSKKSLFDMYDFPITVLMPVYNAEFYLREAIDSILGQTFRDFEFLIINDGSTDASKEIIQTYSDSRIRFVENDSNIKLIATLNKGIAISRGKYIVRMDADDISMPERLDKLYAFMELNDEVGLCGSWFETFSAKGTFKTVQYSTDDCMIRLKHLHQIHLSHGTCIVRTEVLREYQLFFNPEYIHAEDFELWTRIGQYTKLANVPHVLYRVRNNDESVSNKFKAIQDEQTKRIIINQFKTLKQDFDDNEYDLYVHFAYSEFQWFDKQKVKKLDELLTYLMNENGKIELLPQLQLQTYWSDKLFHICYNVANCLDIWENSVFYDKKKMTMIKSIKKLFKA